MADDIRDALHARRITNKDGGTEVRLGQPHLPCAGNLRGDIQLDPKRRVASHWKRTPYDGTSITEWPSGGPGGKKWQTVFGWTDSLPDHGGPYRVRFLDRKRGGEVAEVDVHLYINLRHAAGLNHHFPPAEPVPDDEKLCGPLLPLSFPETFRAAREQAAEALGKKAKSLSQREVIEFFREREPDPDTGKTEILKP